MKGKMKEIVGKAAVFVKKQGGNGCPLGWRNLGWRKDRRLCSKVTIGEWIMDYDEPTFCPTWL